MSADPLVREMSQEQFERNLKIAVAFIARRFPERHGHAVLMFLRAGEPPIHCAIPLQKDDRWEIAERFLRWHGTPADRRDVYLGVANYAAAPTGKSGGTRTKAMVGHVSALYCERDAATLDPRLPTPTRTVETSAGHFQDYWDLDTPTDGATAESYLRRIAAACGLGNEAVDCVRVLRVPGFCNQKPTRNSEIVRVVTETKKVYRLGDFDHLPDLPVASKPQPAADGGEKIPEGGRHAALLNLAGAMRRRGSSEPVILTALREMNEARCDPPTDDAEVQRIARDAEKWPPAPPDPSRAKRGQEAPTPLRPPPPPLWPEHVDPETGEIDPVRATTDYGNAERLVDHHGDDLRYCHPFGKWLAWDGNCWQIDTTAEVMRRAKQAARRIYQEAADAADPAHAKELAKHAIRSEGDARLRAMIGLAESEPGIPILPEHLDADPWLLNVENGTIDLKTGNLRPHDRADLITKLAPVIYDKEATCPTFDRFLARILPSESLRKFMQRVVGYALTGDTREDAIFINYGDGNNGKTTLVETVQALMGNYAMQTPVETLLVKRGEGIPNDVARLRGARFVAAAEGDEGRRLAEGLIKQLTGGDKVTARFLHGEFFEFPPTFKISLSTNHKPIIRGTDEGIWRRIRLVPFTVTIPKEERDADLPTTLRAELPGILNWALAGCLAWQQDGLGMPEEIEQAVKSYREEMSPLQEFVEDRCFIKPDLWQPSADLWDAYQRWSTQAEGRRSVPKKDFAAHLRAFGCLPDKVRRVAGKNVRGWEGIGLLAPDGAPPPAQKPLETDDSLAAPEDSATAATAATAVTAFPAYFSRDFSHEELPGNAVTCRSSRSSGSDGGRDRAIPPDLPPMARRELEVWSADIASGWGCPPNDLVRARAAAAALLALDIPEDASAEMVAKLIVAALPGGPR